VSESINCVKFCDNGARTGACPTVRNNLKNFSRHIIAGIIAAIYIVTAISPLAPLALKSATVAHAVTGECTGDCNTCGCSPERMASHTCCCWQKKLKNEHRHHKHEERKSTCCKKKMPDTKTILSCNCPCGRDKQPALWGEERLELLPYRFSGEISYPREGRLSRSIDPLLTTRYCEPPKPPPKLSSQA
jgi:hypothetical protein